MKGLGLALRRHDLDARAQADGAQPHLENPGSMPLATLPREAMVVFLVRHPPACRSPDYGLNPMGVRPAHKPSRPAFFPAAFEEGRLLAALRFKKGRSLGSFAGAAALSGWGRRGPPITGRLSPGIGPDGSLKGPPP
jgi:hypothetical protein